jgi:long-subunit acyl-CoA synthetase (AMP-forming)
MKENFSEVVFSVPYEMAAVRPLRQTSRQERQAALQAACYNTELIPQELVYVDLKTDSGVSAFSTRQMQRPFIAALIVPDKKLIAAELKKAESALSDGEIEALIRSRLEEINSALEAYERVRKFRLMPSDFPPEVRSVSVFEKIKIERTVVQERYEKIISTIYSTVSDGGSV